MKRLKLIGVVLLSVMLAEFSGATLRAEYHHVDDCSVCHYAGGAESTACGSCPNNLMIKCEVVTPNSGTKATVFGPYVWTEAPFNGVCEVCHTGTMYHQNNASGDHTHFNAENCTLCHKHSDEFAHGEGQACDTCHGHDGGAGTYQSHSTHTESDSDDLKGPNKTCDTCHDTNNYFRFADSATTLSATTVCDNCHSPGGVFDGVDDPEVGAKANWEDGVYEADGTTLKAGKEKWCATCHDDNPAYSRIQLPVIIIVDNPDGSFTGTWGVSSSIPGFYGTDYHYHSTGSGSDTFTWTPAINSSGIYEVFARWSEQPSRAPDATYTIYHDGGNTDVQVDQRSNGGKWVSLGFYTFDGVNDYVELVDSPNGYVVADAIKWIKETEAGAYAPQVIGDNATWGFYATGHGMRGVVDCLDCHVAKRKHIDHIQRSFQADETTRTAITDYSDSYRLPAHALKMPRPNPSMGVKYADFSLCLSCHSAAEILPGDGSLSHTNFRDEHHVSNGINGHAYHIARNEGLADSDWDQNYADSDATCVICHNIHGPPNAAMLRHGELISTDENDRRPALDFSYRKPQPYPRATATYTATSLPAGDYEVYAWWVKGDVGLRTTKARHTITHDGGSDEVLVNQNVHGGGGGVWYLLGTYPYTEGATGTVVIDNEFYDGGRYIIADAIRWQQITGGTYEVIVDNLDAVFTNDLSTWTAASHPEQWDSDYMFIEAHLPPTDPETTLTGSAGGYIAHNTKTCYTACHNTPIYESWFRTPVLWPKVIYHPGPNVDAFPNDGSQFSITVTIVDPDDNVTGVTIDLSALGGPSNGPMTDNLDGTYTYQFSVPVGTPDLLYTGTITATDADLNTGTYEFSEYVTDPEAIYVENTEAFFVPACEQATCDYTVEWAEDAGPYFGGSAGRGHGGTHHIKLNGDGSGTATWPLTIPTAGNYEVYAWWNNGSTYWRSQEVTYTVNYSGGSAPVIMNQEVDSDQWNLLGTFHFDAGSSGSVVVDDDVEPKNSQTCVVADAIKLMPVP